MNVFSPPVEHASRTDVDVATGILVGLRGCSVPAARAELLGVAADNRVSPFSVARALITRVSGAPGQANTASAVVELRWSDLLSRTGGPLTAPAGDVL